jgi:CRISPR-associated protein Cmr6
LSRRDVFSGDQPEALQAPHPGLWLDRFILKLGAAGGAGDHLESLLRALRVPPAYPAFFRRWEKSLQDAGAVNAKATVRGRMVVGLGGESVLETSIALHRTYGIPFIPGSALKGLAATVARQRTAAEGLWHPGGEAFRTVFGELEDSGFVTFHDALWVPAGTGLPLDRDVMTVHHADYYQGQDVPPADWDDPTPVAFLSARGTYLLALTGPKEWAEAAMDLLAIGLREHGIGAKTAAGYGRLDAGWEPRHIRLLPSPQADRNGQEDRSGAERATATRPTPGPLRLPWELILKGIDRNNAEARVPAFLKDYQGAELPAAARATIQKLDPKWLKEPKRRDKEWVKALVAAAAPGG